MTNTLSIAVPLEHPCYAGHFPGFPIVPGVMTLAWSLAAVYECLQRPTAAHRLAAVKFLAPVYPGDDLKIEYTVMPEKLTVEVSKTQSDHSIKVAHISAVLLSAP